MATPTWKTSPQAHRDPMIGFAIDRIEREYRKKVIVNRKTLEKFGRNASVGTSLVSVNSWNDDEALQTDNVVLKMSSTSTSDVDIVVTIEYMYFDDSTASSVRFGVMTATLQGQSKVDLPVAACRWTRMYTDDDVLGDVYIYRDTSLTGGAPTDTSFIHNHIPLGYNQSQKAATTIAGTNFLLMTQKWVTVNKKVDTSIEAFFFIGPIGGPLRAAPAVGAGTGSTFVHQYRDNGYRVIPPNYDIVVKAISTGAGTGVSAGFDGIFADIYGTV